MRGVILLLWLTLPVHFLSAQESLNNQRIDGYRGIWFTLGQFSEYGDKYSGGLGTYTAKHIPLAYYSPEADKTFFVYGGTTAADQKHLLCMISYYDHQTGMVPKPVVVHDKMEVIDPHDDPSLWIDEKGYIWVFVSGRGTRRMGFKYRSVEPYKIDKFEQITEEEMTYPQPKYIPGKGFLHLFTKYSGIRELYFETSEDGYEWTEDQKIAGIVEDGATRAGHYQVSNQTGNKISTFFNRHPDGNVDQRTDLYYLETTDMGKSWQDIEGKKMDIPLTKVSSSARGIDYAAQGNNVYLKDLNFDQQGNPVCLYVTSGGHQPGPDNQPYEWRVTFWNGETWQTAVITTSDHNYDMGSLYIEDKTWRVLGPTGIGPQKWQAGGEMELWESKDQGKNWKKKREITINSKFNHTYARRPVNASQDFYAFWADGDPTEFSISRLYFVDKKGKKVFQLPYEMNQDLMKPTRKKFK